MLVVAVVVMVVVDVAGGVEWKPRVLSRGVHMVVHGCDVIAVVLVIAA